MLNESSYAFGHSGMRVTLKEVMAHSFRRFMTISISIRKITKIKMVSIYEEKISFARLLWPAIASTRTTQKMKMDRPKTQRNIFGFSFLYVEMKNHTNTIKDRLAPLNPHVSKKNMMPNQTELEFINQCPTNLYRVTRSSIVNDGSCGKYA